MENLKSQIPLDVILIDETWNFQHGSDFRTQHDDNIKYILRKKKTNRWQKIYSFTKMGL